MGTLKPVILFGAGGYGKKALDYFGRENVYCFADNNKALEGQRVLDVPVISFERLKKIYKDYDIVISTGAEVLFSIAAQLEKAGIHEYQFFLKILGGEKNSSPPPELEQIPFKEPPDDCRQMLMAAYFFPPLSGSGVFRSIKFAKYLPHFHWWPTVISTDFPPLEMNYMDESLSKEIPAGMEVIRVPDLVYTMRMSAFPPDTEEALVSFLKMVLRSSREAAAMVESLSQTRMGRAKLLTFPCPALLWAYEVIQYIEKNIDLSKFQAIYTTASPYSAHLIGFYLKQKYGIPWVADYRDPWTQSAYLYDNKEDSKYKLLFELESMLLKEADCNLWVEENMTQQHRKLFHLPQSQVSSITNGYDETDFLELEVSKAQPEKFTITYSGVAMLPANIKGIQACFFALRQLFDEKKLDSNNVCFRFFGDARQSIIELAEAYELSDIVQQTGYCMHREALQANLDSNILLLVVGDKPQQKYVHSSKFFEYLRSGRPILALTPTDGIVAQTLRDTGHGEAHLSTDLPEIKAMFLREYQKWQRNEERVLLHSPLIEQFERKNLTGELVEVLERCVH